MQYDADPVTSCYRKFTLETLELRLSNVIMRKKPYYVVLILKQYITDV